MIISIPNKYIAVLVEKLDSECTNFTEILVHIL